MSYLKFQTIIKPVNSNLLELFDFINSKYNIDIYNCRILEIGIGTGNKSIELAKLFRSYYGIEQNIEIYKIFQELCKNSNCKIKSFSMDFASFVDFTNKKFKLILLENVIHFLKLDDFIIMSQKIIDKSCGFILIKNPKALPFGWGDRELCEDSELFNKNKWIYFRNKLESIYEKLSNSEFIIKKHTCDIYHYFLLKI